jgi:hypothetical protein
MPEPVLNELNFVSVFLLGWKRNCFTINLHSLSLVILILLLVFCFFGGEGLGILETNSESNSFFAVPQCNMQEGMEGNPVASTMKNVSRGLAVLTVPFTMGFPKVISYLLVALYIL